MANGIDWFRWHHGTFNDPKFRVIARKAGVRPGDVIALWAHILEEASASSDRGSPGFIDFESVAEALSLEEDTVMAIYKEMEERLIDTETGRVLSWEKRQPKREREGDNSTERTRAYRDRKKSLCDAQNVIVTTCDANECKETPREEKSREERTPHSVVESADNFPAPDTANAECAPVEFDSSLAAKAVKAMRQAGLQTASASSPKLNALLTAGITIEELADAARDAARGGKNFAWALATAEGRRRDAAATAPLPAKTTGPPRPAAENFDQRQYGSSGRL